MISAAAPATSVTGATRSAQPEPVEPVDRVDVLGQHTSGPILHMQIRPAPGMRNHPRLIVPAINFCRELFKLSD